MYIYLLLHLIMPLETVVLKTLLMNATTLINVTNLDNIKSKDITLLTKVHTAKAMVSSLVMYRCESWTIKKAEHQRIDAFKEWC